MDGILHKTTGVEASLGTIMKFSNSALGRFSIGTRV